MTKKFHATGTVCTGAGKNSLESDDLVKLVDRIGIIICGEKKCSARLCRRIDGLNNAWLVNSVYLRCHCG